MDSPSPPRERQELINLAARIPDSEISAAKQMLQALLDDPMWQTIQSASIDTEELSQQGREAIAKGRAEIEKHDTVSHEEVLREFGR